MIRVTDDYVITMDERQYIVCRDMHKQRKKKDSEEMEQVYRPLGYFGTLEGSFDFILDSITREQLGEKEYTIEEALMLLRQVKAFIHSKMEG